MIIKVAVYFNILRFELITLEPVTIYVYILHGTKIQPEKIFTKFMKYCR